MPRRADSSGAWSELSLRRRTSGSSVAGSLLEHGCHGATRPAPRRPHVHQDGNVVALHVTLEARRVDIDGVAGKERLMTRSTAGAPGWPACGHAVYLAATTADDVISFAHGLTYMHTYVDKQV